MMSPLARDVAARVAVVICIGAWERANGMGGAMMTAADGGLRKVDHLLYVQT
jgi:hypothetical protein